MVKSYPFLGQFWPCEWDWLEEGGYWCKLLDCYHYWLALVYYQLFQLHVGQLATFVLCFCLKTFRFSVISILETGKPWCHVQQKMVLICKFYTCLRDGISFYLMIFPFLQVEPSRECLWSHIWMMRYWEVLEFNFLAIIACFLCIMLYGTIDCCPTKISGFQS